MRSTDALVLAAARIAEDLTAGYAPRDEAVFQFAATVVGAASAADRRAAQLGFELAAGLLDRVPPGQTWSTTSGRLWAVKVFAWLHLERFSEVSGAMHIRENRTPLEP